MEVQEHIELIEIKMIFKRKHWRNVLMKFESNILPLSELIEEISIREKTKHQTLRGMKNKRYKFILHPITNSLRVLPVSSINNGIDRMYSQRKNRMRHNRNVNYTCLEYWYKRLLLHNKSIKRKDWMRLK